jgi:DNA-binding NarL/FixJ family response regulator
MLKSARVRVVIQHADPLISAGIAAVLGGRCDFETRIGPPAVSTVHTPGLPQVVNVVVADYEAGLRCAEDKAFGGPPVLILTTSDSEASIFRALQDGVRGYLLAGCSVLELVDGLRCVSQGGVALSPLVASRMGNRLTKQPLTPRESQVLHQLMLGRSNKVIAGQLDLAVGTVKTHVKSVLHKLGASSRTAAVSVAHSRGMLPQDCGSSLQNHKVPSEIRPSSSPFGPFGIPATRSVSLVAWRR